MDFESDEQRAEAVREWLKQNGPAIGIGVVLGLGGLFGWQQYTAYQNRQMETVSAVYQQAVVAAEAGDLTTTLDRVDAVRESGPDAAYATLGDFLLAQTAVADGDLALAAEALQRAVDKAPTAELKTIARLRLARVQVAAENSDAAKATLATVDDPAFEAERQTLLGDALGASGDSEAARSAYQAALAAGGDAGLIDLKLSSLPAERRS